MTDQIPPDSSSAAGHEYDPVKTVLTTVEQIEALQQWYWHRIHQLMLPEKAFTLAVTQLLLILLAVFIATTAPTFSKPSQWSLEWGILYAPWVFNGEWWRIITGQLMHANTLHFLSNGFGLWIFGRQIEPLLGQKGMWGLYGVCAVLTAGFTLFFENHGSIGASGITYGILGCNVMLVFLIRRQLDKKRAFKDGIGLLLLSVAYVGMNLTTANLNIWGHLGGFIGGLVFAGVWFLKLNRQLQHLLKNQPLNLEG